MQFMSLMGLGTIFWPQKSWKSTGGASEFWAACVCSRVCTWSRRWFCGAPFSALHLSLASFWRQLTQHLLWILILDIDYMRRVEALKCFGQPCISSVLLSYSITCSFQFTMWTVWASLQRFTCSNTCSSVCEGLSQYSHAEGTRGCANTTRVITSIQTDLHLPVKFHLTSRWFPRLVYAAERFSMCQFHACADFNHYTLCYSCVNHLIQHIKAFRVLLVKYASLHLSPSLCSWVCLLLSSTATAVPLKTHQQLSGKWPCWSGVCVRVYVNYIQCHL